jgi:hypothetical protein
MITRRIFVDSRDAQSGHSGNFLYTLPEQLVLPKNAVLYVTDLSMPHAFYSVDQSNRALHLIETQSAVNTARKILLTEGAYDVLTLRTALELALNAGKTVSGTYTVTHNNTKNSYTISLDAGCTFRYFSDFMLATSSYRADFISAGLTPTFPYGTPDDLLGLSMKTYGSASTLTTGHIDIRNIHQAFLHSSSLTSYNTSGPLGTRSCLCRVPITTQYGDMISFQHSGLLHDYVNCGAVSASTLQFSLKDSYNQDLDLQGGDVSFTLLFAEQPVI